MRILTAAAIMLLSSASFAQDYPIDFNGNVRIYGGDDLNRSIIVTTVGPAANAGVAVSPSANVDDPGATGTWVYNQFDGNLNNNVVGAARPQYIPGTFDPSCPRIDGFQGSYRTSVVEVRNGTLVATGQTVCNYVSQEHNSAP